MQFLLVVDDDEKAASWGKSKDEVNSRSCSSVRLLKVDFVHADCINVFEDALSSQTDDSIRKQPSAGFCLFSVKKRDLI